MAIRIYNSLTRQLEPFEPMQKNKVGIYACGITVYDEAHMGHAMQAVLFDTLRNYLEYCGYEVIYVRNYTDVDDKIIARAIRENREALEIASHYIEETRKDLAALNVRPATVEPRVSDHIEDIIRFIEALIKLGKAYVSGGDVLFDVLSFPEYGKLSNRKISELRNQEENTHKRNPQDFVLWKAAKADEPFWESPWGPGRPGWHIECSAMAKRYLGDSFDIHGGGRDLIFPHHENEVAQSEALTQKPLARYWVHNGLVMVDKKKMSKSLGNFYTLKEGLKEFGADAIRYLILSHNYSSNMDFSRESFRLVRKRIYYYYKTLSQVDAFIKENPDTQQDKGKAEDSKSSLLKIFEKSMNDNFNSPAVLASFSESFKEINSLLSGKKKTLLAKKAEILRFRKDISTLSEVLGILRLNPEDYLKESRDQFLQQQGITEAMILQGIESRMDAKARKDFEEADRIRKEWLEKGIRLMDTAEGTAWEVMI